MTLHEYVLMLSRYNPAIMSCIWDKDIERLQHILSKRSTKGIKHEALNMSKLKKEWTEWSNTNVTHI